MLLFLQNLHELVLSALIQKRVAKCAEAFGPQDVADVVAETQSNERFARQTSLFEKLRPVYTSKHGSSLNATNGEHQLSWNLLKDDAASDG